jgi:uncharacterized cupin superfamily protein
MSQDRKKPIANISDVALRTNSHGNAFEAQLGRIGDLIGAEKLGCTVQILPAGKKAFPRHAHHANEEMFVVLAGNGTYVAGDESWPIGEGDVIAAPAGTGETAHQIINSSQAELKYLAVSTKNNPDVVEYPDSNKFLVLSGIPTGGTLKDARIQYMGREETDLDYWDGEDA